MPFNIGPGELIILLIIFAMMALPLVVLVLVVRAMRSGPPATVPWAPIATPASSTLDAQTLLAERLARGEITHDEHDTAMRALGMSDGPG